MLIDPTLAVLAMTVFLVIPPSCEISLMLEGWGLVLHILMMVFGRNGFNPFMRGVCAFVGNVRRGTTAPRISILLHLSVLPYSKLVLLRIRDQGTQSLAAFLPISKRLREKIDASITNFPQSSQ